MLGGKEKSTFRELLIPHLSNPPPSLNSHLPHLAALTAIGDTASPPAKQELINRIAGYYSWRLGVVRPDNFFLLVWDICIVVIVLFYILEMGFLLGFGQQFWQDELRVVLGFHILFILMLVLDGLLAPLKAFYQDGLLITDIPTILRKYLQLQGPIDLLAIISIIIPLASGSLQANWVKLVWILKFYTVGRINVEFQRVTQLYIRWSTGYLVVKLTVVGVLYAHYMGIFFYLVSLWVYNNNYYGPNTPNLCWIYNSWAFYQMTLILSWWQTYIYIMYFSIAVITTIAYGDITPKSPIECVYIIVVLIMVTLIIGYIMTEILRLLINVFTYNFQRTHQHFELVEKLRTEKVRQETQAQIRAHTDQIDREEQYRNRQVEQDVISFLPKEPLYALLGIIYSDFLKQLGLGLGVKLGVELGQAALRGVKLQTRSLFLQGFMKDIKEERKYVGDVLYRQGESSDSRMGGHCAYYFTKKQYIGSVTLGVGQMPNLKAGKVDNSARNNCYELTRAARLFGGVQMLTGQRRSHWAVCLSNCVVFVAERESIFNHYTLLAPQEREMLQQRVEQVRESCMICREEHPSLSCPYAFLTRSVIPPEDVKASRKRRFSPTARTRLKTLSSWTLYKRIRGQRLRVTREYKDKLMSDRTNHALFVEYQLHDDNHQEDQGFQMRLLETQLIVQHVYTEAAEERNACALEFDFDRVASFTCYRPHNNIEDIKKDYNSRERRMADFKRVLNANLLKIFG